MIVVMHICLRPLWPLILCALLVEPLAYAQVKIETTVHTEYAEVLRVEPVSLPLPAAQTGKAMQCAPMQPLDPSHPPPTDVTNNDVECIPPPSGDDTGTQVVYDVDYILRGIKYRSRLPFDPGNRLQVQFSVTPMMPSEAPPPASF